MVENTETSQDLVQIGTSIESKRVMDLPEMRDLFLEAGDKIKFAVCIALANNLEPVTSGVTYQTSHAFSALDSDGRLAGILNHHKNSKAPARLTQQLAEAGFQYIASALHSGASIRDLI